MMELAPKKMITGYSITTRPAALVVIFLFLALMVMSSFESIVYDIRNFSLSYSDNIKSVIVEEEIEEEYESCLRPRRNSDAIERAPLQPPFINLGMPKMGSTSLHHYFQCAGHNSVHWKCGKKKNGEKIFCGECMVSAIQAGRSPLAISKCIGSTKKIQSYAQIDRGPENLLQVNYLNEIVGGVSNATFILTFRNMTNWYRSLTNWHPPDRPEKNMRYRFERANITGFPKGVGRNVSEFSSFYCEYVKRVRKEVAKYPGHTLVEIDIEDATAGLQMEEAFGISDSCWGHQNSAKHNGTVTKEELQR